MHIVLQIHSLLLKKQLVTMIIFDRLYKAILIYKLTNRIIYLSRRYVILLIMNNIIINLKQMKSGPINKMVSTKL